MLDVAQFRLAQAQLLEMSSSSAGPTSLRLSQLVFQASIYSTHVDSI